jgi:hypothetical protein
MQVVQASKHFFDSGLCKRTGRNASSQPLVGLYRPSSFNSGGWRINPATYNALRAPETHRFSFPKILRPPLPTAGSQITSRTVSAASWRGIFVEMAAMVEDRFLTVSCLIDIQLSSPVTLFRES